MTRTHLHCGRAAQGALCALYFVAFVASLCLFISVVNANSAQLTLAWDPSPDPVCTGYKVYWGTVSGNYSWSSDAGSQATHTVPDLAEGATYYFVATAYDAARTESSFSNEVAQTVSATCAYTISPASGSFGAGGGTGQINVTTASTCNWTTSNTSSWVSITEGASVTGPGTVAYSVAPNAGSTARAAGLTVAGNVFTINQSGAQQSYTINVTAGANGSVSPSGAVTVTSGANQAFTITPASGYRIQDVKVDGTSVGQVNSFTFTNVTANHRLQATFKQLPRGKTARMTN